MVGRARRRVQAVGFGLALLAFAELALRLSPFAPPTREEWSRQYGVISIEHYYAEAPAHIVEVGTDEGGAWCGPAAELVRTGDSRIDAMEPARWRCDKPAGTFRVVMLGESSVQGFGLGKGETLPDRLQEGLAGRSQTIEVINAGVAGYNSLQILRLLPEIWRLSPDLLVLYAGHNDFTYYPVVEAALAARPSLMRARQITDAFALLRLGRALLVKAGALPEPPPIPPARQGPLPKPSPLGPAVFNQPAIPEPPSAAAHAELIAAQEKAAHNIRSLYVEDVTGMVEAARAHGAAFALVTPVCRLDGMIGRSIHWRWLEPAERAQWDNLWPAVRTQPPRGDDQRVATLLAIDPTYADLQQIAGLGAIMGGDREAAAKHFVAGLDHMAPTRSDRAPWGFGDNVLAVGKELGVPTLDLRPDLLRTVTAPPPATETLFGDVIHFSPDGAEFVATRIATFLDGQGLVPK